MNEYLRTLFKMYPSLNLSFHPTYEGIDGFMVEFQVNRDNNKYRYTFIPSGDMGLAREIKHHLNKFYNDFKELNYEEGT